MEVLEILLPRKPSKSKQGVVTVSEYLHTMKKTSLVYYCKSTVNLRAKWEPGNSLLFGIIIARIYKLFVYKVSKKY